MIKWMLTTLLLMLTVAVVTVVWLVPTLRTKSENLIKSQTEMVKSRVADLQQILSRKQLPKILADKPAETIEKTVAAEKPASPAKTASKTAAQPAQSSTPQVIPDSVSDSDRRKLEEVLEKANK